MRQQNYRAVAAWFTAHPVAKRVFAVLSNLLVASVYLLYGGMLAWLVWQRDARLWRVLVVPAVVLFTGTLLRRAINRPRPYEVLDFTPTMPRQGKGESLPSRHCFSAAAIAVAAWYLCPALGVGAAVLAVCVAVTRVLAGVHWPGDVAAGLCYGAALATAGFWLL